MTNEETIELEIAMSTMGAKELKNLSETARKRNQEGVEEIVKMINNDTFECCGCGKWFSFKYWHMGFCAKCWGK